MKKDILTIEVMMDQIEALLKSEDESFVNENCFWEEGCPFYVHIALSMDSQKTQFELKQLYGHGHTFDFQLPDYETGKMLAQQLFEKGATIVLNIKSTTNKYLPLNDNIYLVIHLSKKRPNEQPLS